MTDTFKKGDRVVLARVRHERYRGLKGTVKQVLKTRDEVRVTLDHDGSSYRAFSANLEKDQ